jgi:hypothetical protein
VPDPADINIVDGKNFGTNVASTMSSAAGSSYLRRSRRRKQHAGCDIDLSSDNKIQWSHDLPADVCFFFRSRAPAPAFHWKTFYGGGAGRGHEPRRPGSTRLR